MHEMQTIVTDMCGVCLSDSLSVCHVGAQLGFTVRGSFDADFANSLWPFVLIFFAVEVRSAFER